MGISRYGVEIGAFADEIDCTLGDAGRRDLWELRCLMGDDALVAAGHKCADEAVEYLKRPVARQGVVLKRCTTDVDRLILLGTARSLAVAASLQIRAVEDVSYIKGSSYRGAAAQVATIALKVGPPISAGSMAPPRR